MRRRVFLRNVGATAVTGALLGLRSSRARASEVQLGSLFGEARRCGKPLLVATATSAPERIAFHQARIAIESGVDRDLAVRWRLVAIVLADGHDIRLLTAERATVVPPSLVLIEGEPPRIAREAKLDRGRPKSDVERFLRGAVPLTTAWLERRAALATRHQPAVVKELHRRMASGEETGGLCHLAPAVVALEALRRGPVARDTLLAEIVAPPPPPPPKSTETGAECDLGCVRPR